MLHPSPQMKSRNASSLLATAGAIFRHRNFKKCFEPCVFICRILLYFPSDWIFNIRFATILRFLNALSFSGWTSSRRFSVRQIFENAMTSYYLIVICVMQAWHVHGPKCWKYFFPQATSRNLIKMLGHLIVRVLSWPKGVCFEPCMTMEDAIEHWFGAVKTCKRGVHGTASTANAIQAAQLLHLQRCQKPPKVSDGLWGCRGRMGIERYRKRYSTNILVFVLFNDFGRTYHMTIFDIMI